MYVLGTVLENATESYVINEASGTGDFTNTANDFVLGQRGNEEFISLSERKLNILSSENIPFQPVSSIVSVSGSISGSNYVEKFVDEDGVTRGNYELIKDTGVAGGSPFGLDKLRFISNSIDLEGEQLVHGDLNIKDNLQFPSASEITSVTQNIFVENEIVNVSTNGSDMNLI